MAAPRTQADIESDAWLEAARKGNGNVARLRGMLTATTTKQLADTAVSKSPVAKAVLVAHPRDRTAFTPETDRALLGALKRMSMDDLDAWLAAFRSVNPTYGVPGASHEDLIMAMLHGLLTADVSDADLNAALELARARQSAIDAVRDTWTRRPKADGYVNIRQEINRLLPDAAPLSKSSQLEQSIDRLYDGLHDGVTAADFLLAAAAVRRLPNGSDYDMLGAGMTLPGATAGGSEPGSGAPGPEPAPAASGATAKTVTKRKRRDCARGRCRGYVVDPLR